MSFIDALRNRPQEERLVAEENKIYRIGFIILSVGILIDIFYGLELMQVNVTVYGSADLSKYVSPLELFSLLVACIVCSAMQIRKGFTTSNKRFADAHSFPAEYYIPICLASGVGAALILGILRSIAEYQVIGLSSIHWAGNFSAGFVFGILVFVLCLVAFLIEFNSAKRQRERAIKKLEEGE